MHPVLVSLAILLLSYLGARFVSFVMEKLLNRAATRTATSIDDRLIVSLKRPVTYVLFVQALATSSVHEEIYRRFAAQGIEIPFPVQRVVQSAGAEAAARGGTTS